MATSLKSEEKQPLEEEGSSSENINTHDDDQVGPPNKSRITIVGSGNWGSVAAKLIASNTLKLPSFHGSFLILPHLFFSPFKQTHISSFITWHAYLHYRPIALIHDYIKSMPILNLDDIYIYI